MTAAQTCVYSTGFKAIAEELIQAGNKMELRQEGSILSDGMLIFRPA